MTGLVLGAGGVLGVAWEAGVLWGLEEAGAFDARDAEVIVGTSAGAVVGALLLLGSSGAEIASAQGGAAPGYRLSPDPEVVAEVFRLWASGDAARIGELALGAPAMPEDEWVDVIRGGLGTDEWPPGDLRIVAVSCRTGERAVWTRASRVGLSRAVAASTAVPGLLPPVSVDGDRYMDGGVWSTTNAGLLAGSELDHALVLAPMAGVSPVGTVAARSLESERDELASRGITVVSLAPGPEFAALGAHLMDRSARGGAVEAGLADARRLAP